MTRKEVTRVLKSLLDTNKLLYPSERNALEYAIKELEKAAQEVPVQEQVTVYVGLDKNFIKEVSEKISELNKLLNQELKFISYYRN